MFFEQYDHEPYVAVVRHRDAPRRARRRSPTRTSGAQRGYAALDAMEAAPRRNARSSSATLHDRRHRALRVHARRGRGWFDLVVATPRQALARARRGAARLRHDRPPRREAVETVSVAQLRRYLVAHHGYATRPRTSRTADVAAEIRRLGCVQLDSISTVDRAHRLTLTSRLGRYPPWHRLAAARRGPDLRVLGARGLPRCPIEDFPLFKRRMVHLERRALVGTEAPGSRDGASRARGDPRARRAAVAGLRGPRQARRDVGWKPAKRGARAPVRGRRARRRRP